MGALCRLSAAVMLVLTVLAPRAPAPAQSDGPQALAGHWRCALSGGRVAERSYAALESRSAANLTVSEVFGREDTTERDGRPSFSTERIVLGPAGRGATITAVEGTGTADAGSPLRFTGRSFDGAASLSLSYAVTGDVLQRTATRGTATVDDERCTREPDPPSPAPCARPNVVAAPTGRPLTLGAPVTACASPRARDKHERPRAKALSQTFVDGW